MNREEITAARETAAATFASTGDQAGYDAATKFLNEQEALLGPDPLEELLVDSQEQPEPRISAAAQKVIDENQLPAELFEGYSVVSVSVARRIAEQVQDAEGAMSPQPELPEEADDELVVPEDLESQEDYVTRDQTPREPDLEDYDPDDPDEQDYEF